MSVTFRDFQPINSWKIDLDGKKYDSWSEHTESQYIIDQSTQKRYLNESPEIIRYKCFLLTLGTPFVHPITSIVNIASRMFKLVTLSQFGDGEEGERKKTFSVQLINSGKDLLRIVATPIAIIGLELAAIYGIFRPLDGRKLYASIERALYGSDILAPCFQPYAKSHAFGGDINKKDAF